MRSILAALRSLVLPAGATSGQRIVLDGVNGLISVYDASNDLRLQIQPASPELIIYDDSGNVLLAVNDTPGSGEGILSVEIPTGSPTALGISLQQQGDTGLRFSVNGSGSLTFGDGTNTLGSTVGILRNTSPLRLSVTEGFSVAEDITWGGETYSEFTPNWGSNGTQPSEGNSEIQGRYKVFGRMVHYYGYILRGSTATNGTGNYTIELPLPAAEVVTTQELWPTGEVWLRDVSATDNYTGLAVIDGSDPNVFQVIGLLGPATSGVWSATSPMTPATGDFIGWNIQYERDSSVIGP